MKNPYVVLIPLLAALATPAPSLLAQPCPEDTLTAQSPLPLTDILTDYLPVDQISGGPVRKITICDREGWECKRPSILRRAEALLGIAPELQGGLEARFTDQVQRRGYLERRVRFNSGTGDTVSGYLLLPDGVSPRNPAPAIIALHSTLNPGAGVTVGLDTTFPNRNYGQELARRGYVVLATDEISAGERVYPGDKPFVTSQFDRKYPQWSAMGKMLADHIRAVDLLFSLAEVDTSRIGTIGHSLGGYNAFFLEAFDSRVKAAVSSCGFVSIGGSEYPFRFARQEWFVHFPVLRDYVRSGLVPCDMHEVLSLCAPRPLFNYSARQDHIFPDFQAVEMPLRQVSELYRILGAAERFDLIYGEGDHDFPAEVREKAYLWLDKWLKM